MSAQRILQSVPRLISNPFRRFLHTAYQPAPQQQISSTYLLRHAKSDSETERLDLQHRLNMRMLGHSYLHPSIPKSTKDIADVATGNGTWLLELRKKLCTPSPSSSPKRTAIFQGFDLSPHIFPKTFPKNVNFSIQNFYNPFPPEHLGKYDMVHIRHAMMAIQTPSDLASAIQNILELLKPGGYIQWEEYDFLAHLAQPANAPHLEVWKDLLLWVQSNGYQLKLVESVGEALAVAGMTPVANDTFTSDAFGPLDGDRLLTMWYCLEMGIPMVIHSRYGKTPEALAQIESIKERCLEDIVKGNDMHFILDRMVFRKPT